MKIEMNGLVGLTNMNNDHKSLSILQLPLIVFLQLWLKMEIKMRMKEII